MKFLTVFLIVLFVSMPVNSVYSQGALCEEFISTTFPPAGWTLEYSGTLYWLRQNYSAFSNGTGSALYGMFSAPAGTIQSLITPVFPATSAGDSLILDMAYGQYPGPDSLIIMTSTDAGSNFIRVHMLGPLQLRTCPPLLTCTTPYWVKRTYFLPAGTNKIKFLGKSGFGDNLILDSICILSHLTGITNINSAVQYSLSQNYPNPFNPTTNIKFSIPKSTFVRLVVTDLLGKEVNVLINDFKLAGNYSVDFDAGSISSGIYFYSLTADDYTETKKMLFVK